LSVRPAHTRNYAEDCGDGDTKPVRFDYIDRAIAFNGALDG